MEHLQRQLSEISLNGDETFLASLRDDDVPKILFLLAEPNKVSGQQPSTQVFTQNDSLVGSEMSNTRLINKFKRSLTEKSVKPLRRELYLRLLKLSSVELNTNSLNTLESNFSDDNDELSEEDDEILRATEVLEMFNLPVPSNIKENCNNIITSKKIPLIQEDYGNSGNTFFVFAENKLTMGIADALSPNDVFLLYKILFSTAKDDERVNDLLTQEIHEDSLRSVPGLKDVAFYYLILEMARTSMINKIYTHKLSFLFTELQQLKQGGAEDPHLDRILNTLSCYAMASHPPGLCIVLIMTDERPGARQDLARVRELFEQEYRYAFLLKENPTAGEIKTITCKMKAGKYKFYDSLVVWFMGHGDKTHLYVKGGRIHRRLDLIQPFTEIEWFNKKPKLFFIQACAVKDGRRRFSATCQVNAYRTSTDSLMVGWRASAGSEWQEKYASYTDMSLVNSFADTLISYATMWYQYASRGEAGSLYIDTLVDQLREYGSKESVENVLQRVHYNVNTVSLLHSDQHQEVTWKQAPFFESSLQKMFIFPEPRDRERTNRHT